MEQPTKNGLPWTGIYRFPEPVHAELLAQMQKVWAEEDWGENYENHRRKPFQSAIYPCTRKVDWNIHIGSLNKDFADVVTKLSAEVAQQFSVPMTLLYAEMVLLTPEGTIPWHHDRMMMCHLSTRVMVPLTYHEDDEIEYYFRDWKDSTPTHIDSFRSIEYIDDKLYMGKMPVGNFYAFNTRVPHATFSHTKKPRGLVQMDMLPTELYENFELFPGKTIRDTTLPVEQGGVGAGGWSTVFQPITPEEKNKISLCEMRQLGAGDEEYFDRSDYLGSDELIGRAKAEADGYLRAAKRRAWRNR